MIKLKQLQQEVKTFYKGNLANGIAYSNLEEVMVNVNKAMGKIGLYSVDRITPLGNIVPMTGTNSNGKERQMFLAQALYEIDIVDPENKEKETFSMVGSAWMNNPSAVYGSIATYNSRYLWSKILRVAFTTEKEVEEQEIPTIPKQTIKTTGQITDGQLRYINTLITKTGTDRDKIKKAYKVESLKNLSKEHIEHLIGELEDRESKTRTKTYKFPATAN